MDRQDIIQTMRRFADGELPETEAAAFRRALEESPELGEAIELERRLRERVGAVMRESCGAAPPGLADRVRAALASSPFDAPRVAPLIADEAATGVGQTSGQVARPRRPSAFRDRWLASAQRTNIFAIAACLLLVAGAVIVGVFGPNIDHVRRAAPTTDAGLVDAMQHAASEHFRCARSGSDRTQKLCYAIQGDAAAELSKWLGAPVLVPDLNSLGYEFIGGGKCGIPPGDIPSGHLAFRAPAADGRGKMISLFIELDRGQFRVVEAGRTRPLQLDQSYEFREWVEHPGRLWTDGRLVYFLVACVPADLPAAEHAIRIQLSRNAAR